MITEIADLHNLNLLIYLHFYILVSLNCKRWITCMLHIHVCVYIYNVNSCLWTLDCQRVEYMDWQQQKTAPKLTATTLAGTILVLF